MLYVTTREKYDAFTAPRTLLADCGSDGGAYVPYRLPRFSAGELTELLSQSSGQIIAQILNHFFSCGLSAWDVEIIIGKRPVKVEALGNRIHYAQLWRNLEGSYEQLEKALARKVQAGASLTSWLRIAIRIATLFAAYAEYLQLDGTQKERAVDISVPADDFLLPMAAWYARQMGLQIHNIICGCQNSSMQWELLHLGETRLDGSADLLRELERLVYGTLGLEEAKQFAAVSHRNGTYKLLPVDAEKLHAGMFCAVVSRDRTNAVIPSVYRTNQRYLAADAALSYAALMDYRAKTGTNRPALLLEDVPPDKKE